MQHQYVGAMVVQIVMLLSCPCVGTGSCWFQLCKNKMAFLLPDYTCWIPQRVVRSKVAREGQKELVESGEVPPRPEEERQRE